MKRALTGGALGLMMVVASAGPAFAGEITGKGKPTPIKSHRAGSICSFSGLNDNPSSQELFDGGHVQSFGDIVQEAIWVLGDGKGASSLVPIITEEGPGVSCRGYASEK